MRVVPRTIAVLAAGAALTLPATALASVETDTARIQRGLTVAQRAHWVSPYESAAYRRSVKRAVADLHRLPRLRRQVIAAQLNQVARQSSSYLSPRARALFGALDFNLAYLESHVLPRSRVDLTADDGVVYRWFPSQGFEFHPLAEFTALNAAVKKGDVESVRQLAYSLLARGVLHGPALRFEYYFPFASGRPPWTSGMAQAVAAQALGAAGTLLGDTTLLQAAQRAYEAVPGGLLLKLGAGPWIRLYGFNHEIVLNAQLQTILSLQDYAQAAGDAAAADLANRMDAAAKKMLPRFDTGYWSLYELRGHEASLGYQKFVTQLLLKLAHRTQDPFWQDAAARFYAYVKQPPQLEPTPFPGPVTLYPQPADGWLDTAKVPFSLSKRSKVTLSAGGKSVTKTLDGGNRVLIWKPGTLPPGTYTGKLTAVDLAGNKTTVTLDQPFVVAAEQPPQVQAQLSGGVLTWQGVDPGTPKLRLVITLTDANGVAQAFDLGFHAVSGTAVAALPPGSWAASLTATNTAGLAAVVDLGQVDVAAPPPPAPAPPATTTGTTTATTTTTG